MYNHLAGKLVEKNPAYAIIECNGIGFQINISLHTFSNIGNEELCRLYTHLQITEDAQTLWGFADEQERKLFRQLISVSGVGCNTARMMLSSMSPAEIHEAIAAENFLKLKSIKGIGEKTAQRIIIDLKDKVKKEGSINACGDFQFKSKSRSNIRFNIPGFFKTCRRENHRHNLPKQR